MKRLVEGRTYSGKTTDAINRYSQMLRDRIDSKKILVFVLNRWERYRWLDEVSYERTSELNIYSYFGFVQKEVELYWPIILRKCTLIKKKRVTPIFMRYEAAQSLMNKTIDYYRSRNYLKEIIGDTEGITKKLLSNLVNASLSNINYKKMGERIYESKIDDERFSREFYEGINEIVDKYIERTLEEGMVDQATSIYLFNNYLLKDESYLEKLRERFEYLIVDDMELSSISQGDLMLCLLDSLKGSILYKNTDGPYGIYQFSKRYIEENIFTRFQREIQKKDKESNNMDFLDYFKEAVQFEKFEEREYSNINLEIDDPYKSKSDKRVLRLVSRLLEEGISPKEIGVVSPRYDVTLDFGLSKIAKDRGIRYLFTAKNERVTDNSKVYSLMIFAMIFYNFKGLYLNYDEVKVFISSILRVNIITAARIALFIRNANYKLQRIDDKNPLNTLNKKVVDDYNRLCDFIEKTSKEIDIDEFFNEVYSEFLFDSKADIDDIKACTNLIDSARDFLAVIDNFDVIKDSNYEFIKFIRSGAKTSETLEEVKDKLEGEFLSLSTPASYISIKKRCKYIILTDIRNPLYTLQTNNELQNLWALNKDWNRRIISNEDLLASERDEVIAIISRLLRGSENVYLYSSNFSRVGFEQNSIISSVLEGTFK